MSTLKIRFSELLGRSKMLKSVDSLLYQDLGLILFYSFQKCDARTKNSVANEYNRLAELVCEFPPLLKTNEFCKTFSKVNRGTFFESILFLHRHRPQSANVDRETIKKSLYQLLNDLCEKHNIDPKDSFRIINSFMEYDYVSYAAWLKKLSSEGLSFTPGMIITEFAALLESDNEVA